jgi:uncharacterized protein with gpF-like domain
MVEKQLDQYALDWIKLRSLTLAKSINKTTLEAIMIELTTGRAANETITQLSKRIEGYFTGNAKARAAMISRTETVAANNEGTIRRLETMGIEKSEFYASPDACEQCLPYVGVYPTSETHGMVPVHPNCKCQIMGVIE